MKTHCYYDSPVGRLFLQSEDGALVALKFDHRYAGNRLGESVEDANGPPLAEAIRQLDEYFLGLRQQFELPLRLDGTNFQIAAWQALSGIPYATTISYKEQAARVGGGARAIGLANGQNPVAIVLPCHRVIGANGSLIGYGGGLERKKALLAFEANVRDFGSSPMPLVFQAGSQAPADKRRHVAA
jgi:methylated-DNA-[protein]-cysteine S-methyltransferase